MLSQQQEQSKQKSAEPNLVETSCFHLLKELIEQEKRNGNHLPALVWYSSKFSYLSLQKPPNGKAFLCSKNIL
jgi:hypothetical protein